MRLFRPEIELTLKALGVFALITMIVFPAAWGYEQRQKARVWQNIACAYRIKEIERRTPVLGAVDYGRDACGTLERLGLVLEMPR
jgi:hypothetical protein